MGYIQVSAVLRKTFSTFQTLISPTNFPLEPNNPVSFTSQQAFPEVKFYMENDQDGYHYVHLTLPPLKNRKMSKTLLRLQQSIAKCLWNTLRMPCSVHVLGMHNRMDYLSCLWKGLNYFHFHADLTAEINNRTSEGLTCILDPCITIDNRSLNFPK